jgi:hypothetical protein
MTLVELENLVKARKLKREPPDQAEFDELARAGEARLKDAQIADLSLEGRFDLAYKASRVLALAALRRPRSVSTVIPPPKGRLS